ncbi:AraC family transcriptional regulator [Maricaulis sp.]|uniref:AraC family transcriptional regulator n=1 Tax=Maricaulis sp. TaxID=1486257 RepID=UPI001B00B52B|nr:AraC family transcriptional regulator [Maricaulis sp.]MBO6795815.1 helix-turn-helix transcriptional regulator [Maricaulis sp.]
MEIVRISEATGKTNRRNSPAAVFSRVSSGGMRLASSLGSIKLVLQGREIYRHRDQQIAVEAGQMLLVRPDMELSCEVDAAHPTRGLCLYVDEDKSRAISAPYVRTRAPAAYMETALELFNRSDSKSLTGLDGQDSLETLQEQGVSIAGAMSEHFLRLGLERELARSALLCRLELARAFLEDCVEGSLDIDRLCRETGMSKFHFMRSFKAAYGTSPKRYWTSTRLLAAMDVAREISEPLEDVALRLGYSDRSSFARAFRRHIGQTPAQFMRATARLH